MNTGDTATSDRRGGGTSWATPIVTGVAAMYLEQFPDATPAELHDLITDGALDGALTGVRPDTPNRLVQVPS